MIVSQRARKRVELRLSVAAQQKGNDVISALDTHERVKSLTAAGSTDAQAEALTAVMKCAADIDLSNLATKTDMALLRGEIETKIADVKTDVIKWVVGMGFAQVAMILAVLKLFPGAHP